MDVTSQLTIVIPVRIDCKERKENLDAVLNSLLKMTNSFVIILEADTVQRYSCKEKSERVEYIFIHDDNLIFYRTRYLNLLLKISETNIVGIWDTDVILDCNQIKNAANAVNNGITLCYPYDGRFLFLSSEQSYNVRSDVASFLENETKDKMKAPILGRPSVGGAFIVNKQRYLQAGGENENFYGWGPEDAERFKRLEILEEPIARIEGPLFHLYHPRGVNSTFDRDKRDKSNVGELIKICRMNKIELEQHIRIR